MAMRNVDELLFQDTQDKLGKSYTPLPEKTESEAKEPEKIEVEHSSVPEKVEAPEQDETFDDAPIPEAAEASEQTTHDVDEYGNEVKKTRMYSEEEVNRMMRERLSRGRFSQEQDHQPAPIKSESLPQDNADNWESQLENFIESTIQRREQKHWNDAKQAKEAQLQAQFETKFNHGMSKYEDFYHVVGNKPITDSMLLATRGMEDPAAFIYTAAKTQAKELERIANIQDPYQQGMEMGRLEERMRKAKAVSSAPRPPSKTAGDMPNVKKEVKHSIDSRIMEHAQTKRRR